MTSHQGASATSEHATGVQNKHYNLISVLYHALQGGETCVQYLHDAEQGGDQELQAFFHEVQDCQRHLASRAQDLLLQRLQQGNGQQSTMGRHGPHVQQGMPQNGGQSQV